MVLVKSLSKNELKRHEELILEWAKHDARCNNINIQLIGNGCEKGVYKIKLEDKELVAVAANRDGLNTLLGEYNKLHTLYRGAPSLVPQPYSHYASVSGRGELITMEFLPHVPVDVFDKLAIPNFQRKLAYSIGHGVARVHARTSMYPSEPHDGNILLLQNGENLNLKFCDASQFRQGSLEDALLAILVNENERPECRRRATDFYSGLADGLITEGKEVDEANIKSFLNKYSPVFI